MIKHYHYILILPLSDFLSEALPEIPTEPLPPDLISFKLSLQASVWRNNIPVHTTSGFTQTIQLCFCSTPSDAKFHDKSESLIHGLRSLTLDKLHIQLQTIDRHLIQHIQRGITASKIIHFDHKAQLLLQMSHRLNDLTRIFRVGAFRDLQMEPGRRQAVIC